MEETIRLTFQSLKSTIKSIDEIKANLQMLLNQNIALKSQNEVIQTQGEKIKAQNEEIKAYNAKLEKALATARNSTEDATSTPSWSRVASQGNTVTTTVTTSPGPHGSLADLAYHALLSLTHRRRCVFAARGSSEFGGGWLIRFSAPREVQFHLTSTIACVY
jgi:chromosome segregation ATPase